MTADAERPIVPGSSGETDSPDRISCSWTVDADARIRAVGGGWGEFATANGAPELGGSSVIGRSLFDAIQGNGVREIYRTLMGRARERGEPVIVALNCAAPDIERILDLTIRPLDDGGFEFSTHPRRVRPTAHNPILAAPTGPEGEGVLEVCSWCKRVKDGEGWRAPEKAYRELEPLITNEDFQITHAMCEDCYERLEVA